MGAKIVVDESFSDEGEVFGDGVDSLENADFESPEMFELRLEAEKVSKDSEIKELKTYKEIKKALEFDLPHQSEGALRILKDMNGSALLADEVGLGKTITAGIVIKECINRGFVKKALILTPPSLVDQWCVELHEKFNLDFKIIESENDWENNGLVIASIDRIKIYDNEQKKYKHGKAHDISWDLLIVDEAHKLKDRTTARWKFVDKIQKKRFLILTATPFQNDLFELYNLLHILKRGHLGTLKEFREKFLHRGNKRHPLNPKDLKKRLDEVMIRRRRDQTGINYMKRMPKVAAIELSKEEKDVYDRICDLLKTKYFSATGSEINGRLIIYAIFTKITSSSRSAMESLSRIAENESYHEKTRKIAFEILEDYKKITKDSKIEKLIEVVSGLLKAEPEEKILIYTKHPTTLKYIVEKLKPFNLKIVEFIGGLEREEKTRILKEFKESAQILICTETGSEGLNLQFCHNLINYDLPWNPMAVEQRIGRLDRIGQKRDIKIFSLATKDTMEEHVVDLIINKMCCIGLVIGELPIILFNLGLDDKGLSGTHKFEEMLMDTFIDSKNNLDVFSEGVHRIAEIIDKGIREYSDAKGFNTAVLDAN